MTQRPLRPEDGEDPVVPPVPRSSSAPPPPAPIRASAPAERSGNGCGKGCLWGLGGAVGCALVIALVVGGLLLATGLTVNGFVNSVVGIFNGEARTTNIFVPKVEAVQRLNELTTVRRSYSNIVTSERDMPELLRGLYGDRLVMVAVGHVDAGVDLSQLTQGDLLYDEATQMLSITLPPVRLQNCFLDENASYTVERATGLFAAPLPDLDEYSRSFALEQFRNLALEDGILEEAREETEVAIRQSIALFNSNADALTITFTHTPNDPDVPLPSSCQ